LGFGVLAKGGVATESRKDHVQANFDLELLTYDSARDVLAPPKIANAHTQEQAQIFVPPP
jgi:hypothetical protein